MSVSENIDCKISIFARIVHIFTNPIIRDCRWHRLLSEYMIVHIFTIKICGMVNETIISSYEIVNLRTILIFVGKNYFSQTKGGGT